jgi:hypothetical protein
MGYRDSDDAYDLIGGLFDWGCHDPEFSRKIGRVNLSMKIALHDPSAYFLLTCRPDKVEWSRAELETTADVEIGMNADTAHRFLRGRVNLLAAVALREIIVKGALTRLMGLLWAIEPMCGQYARILQNKGRADLLS